MKRISSHIHTDTVKELQKEKDDINKQNEIK